MNQYLCRSCGQQHEGPPLSYGVAAPEAYSAIPKWQRRLRTALSSDQCIIDGKQFFVQGNIEIPIRDSAETFAWTVWVSLSPANFQRTTTLWETPGRESEAPYFGWLSTALPYNPSTINLKTMVHTRPVGERPFIELEPTDHPLAVEQRTGISWERVQEIAERILHGTG